ncbi:MAG: PstS family phosphate ABC transporter substrate-binding protein [Phycisphaerales bacterium]
MLNVTLPALLGAALTVIAAASTACGGSVKGAVKVDGSSTVAPISMAVAEEFKKAEPGVDVAVGISGTGGGFKKFVAGEIDVADASRPISKEEVEKAASNGIEFIELPVAFDGLSFVINPKNDWAKDITLDEIKKIYLEGSAVKTWKDIRPSWPDRQIKLYSPGTDSGTFDYFKEVVAGKKGAIRGDMSVSEDDNVLVRGVEGDVDALGFFGFAYYIENKEKLGVLAVDAGKGAVTPSHDSIEKGQYAPFSRPLLIYVNRKSAEKPAVKAFVNFYIENMNELAEQVGYVKLPEAITKKVKAIWETRAVGSKFLDEKGGHKHAPLAEILGH